MHIFRKKKHIAVALKSSIYTPMTLKISHTPSFNTKCMPFEAKIIKVTSHLPWKNWRFSLTQLRVSSIIIWHRPISLEPPRGKTNNLHRRKQRRRSAVTAKLISTFVFATRIVQFLFYLNPKFQASSSFLCLYRPVCVGPGRKPHCWFSHEAAQF